MNGDIYVKVTIEKKGKFQICYFSFRFLNNIDRSMQNGGGPIFIFDDNGLTVCVMMCHNK